MRWILAAPPQRPPPQGVETPPPAVPRGNSPEPAVPRTDRQDARRAAAANPPAPAHPATPRQVDHEAGWNDAPAAAPVDAAAAAAATPASPPPPPLDLSLPARPWIAPADAPRPGSGVRAQALNDPRANSRAPHRLEEGIRNATTRNDRAEVEERGLGRRRVRGGGRCVDVQQARIAQIDPMNEVSARTMAVVEPCPSP